jgi:hypothetical protein
MAIRRYSINERSLRRVVAGTRRLENQFPLVPLARPPATRTPIVADLGVPFTPYNEISSPTIPAYGVFLGTSAWPYSGDSASHMLCGDQCRVHGGGPIVLINGDADVAPAQFGVAQRAINRPAWALYDPAHAPGLYDDCGPEASTFYMARGLPGFLALDIDTTNERVLVLRTEGNDVRFAVMSEDLTDYSLGAPAELQHFVEGFFGLSVTAFWSFVDTPCNKIPAGTSVVVQFWPWDGIWEIIAVFSQGIWQGYVAGNSQLFTHDGSGNGQWINFPLAPANLDFTAIAGYNAALTQTLKQVAGVLQWV